jgi:hypothetical protein
LAGRQFYDSVAVLIRLMLVMLGLMLVMLGLVILMVLVL